MLSWIWGFYFCRVPYTRTAKDKFPKTIEGKHAGEGFRQWVSLNYDEYADEENKKVRWGRALAVKHYYDEKKSKIAVNTKLWCFGYDATNANVKCWYESIMPTFQVPNEDIEALKAHISDALQIAYQISDELRFSIIRAWFRPRTEKGKQTWKHLLSGKKKDKQTGRSINHALKADHLSSYHRVEIEYWESLEKIFSAMVDEFISYGNSPGKPLHIYVPWVGAIQKYCLNYFDRNALSEAIDEMDMKNVIEAKNDLFDALYPKKKCFLKDINEFKKEMEVTS